MLREIEGYWDVNEISNHLIRQESKKYNLIQRLEFADLLVSLEK